MAIRDNDNQAISYDSDELIHELKVDIAEFGSEIQLYAFIEFHNGAKIYIDYDFIVDEKPLTENEKENNIEIIQADKLLKKLEAQNSLF